MNITELARRLKIPTEQLKDELPKLGFDVGRRAIKIDDVVAEKVVKLWSERLRQRQQQQYVVVEKKFDSEKAVVGAREAAIANRISPKDLALVLGLPVTTIMAELFRNGVMAAMNEMIDFETASIIAQDLGFKTVLADNEVKQNKKEEASAETLAKLLVETEDKLVSRPPVVVVMGHVDHGKTTLLDTIRSTNVVAMESGAITQHIGAYQVEDKGRKITFLDTPGHEAFAAMRTRGGRLADVAIIVVAADDGLQPQTLEAIGIAQKENLPFLIAINKVDRPTANIDMVKKALAEINLIPEDWGGKTICVPISAKQKQGITELLDMVLLLADMQKIQANPNRSAAGTIIEAKLDKGEGPIATALIQTGTLKIGDNIVVGNVAGKVRAMRNFMGQPVTEADPSMPVRILGLKGVPSAGDIWQVETDESVFKNVLRNSSKFQRVDRVLPVNSNESSKSDSAITSLNIILKTDVLGSREALTESLQKLSSPEVAIKIVKTGLGTITESDVIQGETSQAMVLGFQVPLLTQVEDLARSKKVFTKNYRVIYDLLDDVKKALEAMFKPELIRNQIGHGVVLKIFRRGKKDMVVGLKVLRGSVKPKTKARIIRAGEPITELDVNEVRLGKELVGEVIEGGECGLSLLGQPVVEENDMVEIYHEEIKRKIIV